MFSLTESGLSSQPNRIRLDDGSSVNSKFGVPSYKCSRLRIILNYTASFIFIPQLSWYDSAEHGIAQLNASPGCIVSPRTDKSEYFSDMFTPFNISEL